MICRLCQVVVIRASHQTTGSFPPSPSRGKTSSRALILASRAWRNETLSWSREMGVGQNPVPFRKGWPRKPLKKGSTSQGRCPSPVDMIRGTQMDQPGNHSGRHLKLLQLFFLWSSSHILTSGVFSFQRSWGSRTKYLIPLLPSHHVWNVKPDQSLEILRKVLLGSLWIVACCAPARFATSASPTREMHSLPCSRASPSQGQRPFFFLQGSWGHHSLSCWLPRQMRKLLRVSPPFGASSQVDSSWKKAEGALSISNLHLLIVSYWISANEKLQTLHNSILFILYKTAVKPP